MILEWMASGASRDEIVRSYPHLSAHDLEEAIRFAAQSVNHEIVISADG